MRFDGTIKLKHESNYDCELKTVILRSLNYRESNKLGYLTTEKKEFDHQN